MAPGQPYFPNAVPDAYRSFGPNLFLPLLNQSSVIAGGDNPSNVAYDPHEALMDMDASTNKMIDPLYSMYSPHAERGFRDDSAHPLNQTGANTSTLGTSNYGSPAIPYGDVTDQFTTPSFPALVDQSTLIAGDNANLYDQSWPKDGGRPFSKQQAARPGRQHDTKTLVVEKIPEDSLSMEAVNNWFKRYGTVTNVAVDVPGAKALVSFATHAEARLAWKAEEAIFNNRFVKTYWHRPLEGKGLSGVRKLESSAALITKLSERNNDAQDSGPARTEKGPATIQPPAVSNGSSTNRSEKVALASKQQLLDKLITEHKSLIAQLDTADAEEKKRIMARLRQLSEDQKSIISNSELSTESGSGDKQMPNKGNLDSNGQSSKELDQKSATAKTRDALQAKLEALRVEVRKSSKSSLIFIET